MSDDTQPQAGLTGEAPPPAVIIYDADAEQRFEFLTERKGRQYKVAHIFGPILDDLLVEMDRARDQRLSEADASETDDAQAVAVSSSTSTGIAADYWTKSGTRAEGYANKVSAKDMSYAVHNLLLAVQVVAAPTLLGEGPCPDDDDEERAEYTLRALFAGREVALKHVLRESVGKRDDASERLSDFEAYQSIMSRALLVQGTQFGQTDQRIPSRFRRLGHLYDRMKDETAGYARRVPLHHKVAVVQFHFRAKQKALAGNSNALPPQ